MSIRRHGFTLIEILIVIGLIAVLAAVVIVAINPGKQFADARNSQRSSNVNSVLNAVYQYAVDNNGQVPAAITTTATEVCSTGAAACTGLIDLSVLTTNGKYMLSLPKDPSTGTATTTKYTIVKDANGRITVNAPSAENGVTISVTR